MEEHNSLYLFTESFPYGTKSETFLETEILYLSEAFEEVYVIPAQKDRNTQRHLPANVHVLNWIVDGKPSPGSKLLFRHALRIMRLFLFMLRSSAVNRRIYLRHFRYYLGKLLGELDYYERLKPHLQTADKSTSRFYTYWFENSILALCLLNEEGYIRNIVSRAHAFDLYDDRNRYRPTPFREYKLQQLEAVYCISAHGRQYLKDKVASVFHPKIELSYLGVKAPVVLPEESKNHILVLMSVSRMVDFKRVGLIAQALKHYKNPLKWIHFGSGPLWSDVQSQVAELPNHIHVELKGHVENLEVLHFYSQHRVDLFISTSKSEGLPVSMMEAQSYGIPILACGVCGIPEIVKDGETGFLMPVVISPEDLFQQMSNAIQYPFDRARIRNYFSTKFDAESNYSDFSKKLTIENAFSKNNKTS
jgi:glycosyltransferase involved in cell wall biosynthesis